MSTSSSATARERAPDSGPQAHPFPYTDTAAQAKPADPPEIEQKHAEQQRLQELEYARQRGQQEVRAEMDAALLRERTQILRAVQEFAAERAQYYRRIESEVVQLALAIARKIMHREAQLDPHALAGIVRVTLEDMDASTKVSLHVATRDAPDWRHYFAGQMESDLALEVREDPALGPGECRIETALGVTEVGFEAQLKEIETGLLDLLAERPGSS